MAQAGVDGNAPLAGWGAVRREVDNVGVGVHMGEEAAAADEIPESQEGFEDDATPDAGPLGVSLKLEFSALPIDQSMAVFVLCKVAKEPCTTNSNSNSNDKPSPASAVAVAAAASSGGGAVSASGGLGQFGGGVGLDLVTILDVSASMSGAKLRSVQDAMRFIISQLTDKDRLCVITFSSAARVELPFTIMTEAKKSLATTCIMRLHSRSGTCIRSGVESAIQCLQSRRTRNPTSAAFLLTDGMDNVGYDPATTRQLVQSCFTANRCAVYPFGFGADHDAVTLGGYAELCHTPFTYIESPSVMGESFAGALGVAKYIKYQDIVLEFKATEADNSAIKAFHSDFDHRLAPGGKIGTLTLPDCVADEERQILLEMEVPEVASPTDTEEAILTLTGCYKDLTARKIFHFAPQTLTIHRVWAPQPEDEPEEADTGENGVPAAAAAAAGGGGGGDSVGAKRLLAMGIRADEEVSMARAERVAQRALTTVLQDETAGRGDLMDQRIGSAMEQMDRLSKRSAAPSVALYSDQFRLQTEQMTYRRPGHSPSANSPMTMQHLSAMRAQRTARPVGSPSVCYTPSSRFLSHAYTASRPAPMDNRDQDMRRPISSHTSLRYDINTRGYERGRDNNQEQQQRDDLHAGRKPLLPAGNPRRRSSAGLEAAAAAASDAASSRFPPPPPCPPLRPKAAPAASAAAASGSASSKADKGGSARGGGGAESRHGKKRSVEEQ